MKRVIAFDIGGTSVRCAVFSGGKMFDYKSVPTPKEKNAFLKIVDDMISVRISKDISGIGIGIASPVRDGVVKNAPNIPLKNFNLKKYLEKKYKKKVVIENDAGCFALAESKQGVKKNNFVLITLGTGIGGGIIIDGKDYRGTGLGAEFGHMYVNGVEWESLWKGTRERIKSRFGEQKLIRELVKSKDVETRRILEEAADYMGQGIASLIVAFDPEVFLIGGGLRESGNVFLNMIRDRVKKYSFLPKVTPINWTRLENPGITGASLLI